MIESKTGLSQEAQEKINQRIFALILALSMLFVAGCSTEITANNNPGVFVTPTTGAQNIEQPIQPNNIEFANALEAATCRDSGITFSESVEKYRFKVLEIIQRFNKVNGANIPADFVLAIMQQESGGDNDAQSSSISIGASGLMQVANFWIKEWSNNIPNWLSAELKFYGYAQTESGFTEQQIQNFVSSEDGQIVVSINFLGEALNRYDQNIFAALAEYNAGPFAGEMWKNWSLYAVKNNINPLQINNDYYLQLKNQAVINLQDYLVANNGYSFEEAQQIARDKFEEVEIYVIRIEGAVKADVDGVVLCTDTEQLSESYKIQPGDTLSLIAQEHGTTVEELMSLNSEVRDHPDTIYAGQVIKIR